MRIPIVRALFSAFLLATLLVPYLSGLADQGLAMDAVASVEAALTVDRGDCDPSAPMDRGHAGTGCIAQCLVEQVESSGAAPLAPVALPKPGEYRCGATSVWSNVAPVVLPRPPARPV